MAAKTVAVLAVQGAFIEHERLLERLGARCIELRCAADLDHPFDALVLPGGESTVQGRLLRELGMLEPLRARIADGLPTLATCAGLVLLAQQVETERGDAVERTEPSTEAPSLAHGEAPVGNAALHAATHLATLPVAVERNASGRQLGSFRTEAPFAGIGTIPMTFIRAPFITHVEPEVEILARVRDAIVAVRCNNQLALAFHPELDPEDPRVHELFLSMAD